jgi:hypothetical protein
MNLALRSIFVHTSKGFLTCLRILRHGADGFISRRKEGVLRIFIALKNPSHSAGYEPANVWSNVKHTHCYTTEDDLFLPMLNNWVICFTFSYWNCRVRWLEFLRLPCHCCIYTTGTIIFRSLAANIFTNIIYVLHCETPVN